MAPGWTFPLPGDGRSPESPPALAGYPAEHRKKRDSIYTTENQNLRLAVLIDADNVPRNSLKSAMEEIAIYGTPTIKRIYGDWTSPNIAGWKQSLLENAVTPIRNTATPPAKTPRTPP